MLKELLESFRDNLKEKSTNPFYGTLVLVWIIHNWKLVYSVFNFDSSMSRESRLLYMSCYFKSQSFTINLLQVIGYTFLALIFSFVLLSASRALLNIYENVVVPWVFAKTAKGKTFLIAEKLELVSANEKLIEELAVVRDEKRNFRNQNDIFENDLRNLKKTFENLQKSHNQLELEKTVLDNTLEESMNARTELQEIVKSLNLNHSESETIHRNLKKANVDLSSQLLKEQKENADLREELVNLQTLNSMLAEHERAKNDKALFEFAIGIVPYGFHPKLKEQYLLDFLVKSEIGKRFLSAFGTSGLTKMKSEDLSDQIYQHLGLITIDVASPFYKVTSFGYKVLDVLKNQIDSTTN